MPYITTEKRDSLKLLLHKVIEGIHEQEVSSVGDLNYIITTIVHTFIEKHGTNYANLNSIIGVLECVKQEYYRRIVTEYETIKIHENGDIYTKDDTNKYYIN